MNRKILGAVGSIVLFAALFAALAALGAGSVTPAHADQAPSPPSCGNNGPNGVKSVSNPQAGIGTHSWFWDVTHTCNGKTFMSEIQVCDPFVPSGCVYQDVQGIHVFSVGNCATTCTKHVELNVPCSDPTGNKQWRVLAYDNNSHVTSPGVWRGGCPT